MLSDIGPRILVNDFSKMFHFYKDVLGYDVNWGDEKGPYVSFSVPGTEKFAFAIFLRKNNEMYDGYKLPEYTNGDNVHLIISVEDCDKFYESLKDKVDFIGEPRDMKDWYMRCVWFRDPEGNLLEANSAVKED